MTKAEIVNEVAKSTGVEKSIAQDVVEATMVAINMQFRYRFTSS